MRARARFSGQVAFITGASSGLGAGLARALAREGAGLALVARREDRLKALSADLEAGGAKVIWQRADVTRAEELCAAVDTTVKAFGHLDLAIANAGFGVSGAVEALTAQDYRRQFETNVMGVLNTVWATLPELRRARGRLAIMGSAAGYVALPRNSAYAMSKFAVRALADVLRGELKAAGVSVTLLSPGFVATDIRRVDNRGELHPGVADPVPPWLRVTVDEAVRPMLRAIDRRRREVVITAPARLAVAVARHAPGLLAWVMGRGVRGRGEPSG